MAIDITQNQNLLNVDPAAIATKQAADAAATQKQSIATYGATPGASPYANINPQDVQATRYPPSGAATGIPSVSASPDLKQTRGQISDLYASEIANIKNYYEGLISSNVATQEQTNVENIGRTRSGLAATGQLGTTAGSEGALATTTQAGVDAIASIKETLGAKMESEIASVQSAQAAGLQQDEQSLLKASIDASQKKIDSVVANIPAIASTMPLSQLDSQTYQQILDASGWTPQELSALWTAYQKPNVAVMGSAASGYFSYDTKTGKKIDMLTTPVAALTPDQKNYEMAKSQGFTGTLEDWLSNKSRKWAITGTDDFGNSVYGWVTPPGATPTGATTGAAPVGETLFGKEKVITPTKTDLSTDPTYGDFYKSLPDPQKKAFESIPDNNKSEVMQLVNGDALVSDLAGKYKGGKALNTLIGMAQKVDPNFSINENKQRYTFKTQWNNPNGKSYSVRTGINTGLFHLSVLKGITDQLTNTNFQTYNSIAQWMQSEANGPQASVVAQFNDSLSLLATEIARAYKGGVPDQPEVERQFESLTASKPANVITDVLNNKVKLMSGLLVAQGAEYKKTIGRAPTDILDTATFDALSKAGVEVSSVLKEVAPVYGHTADEIDQAIAAGFSDSQIYQAITTQ